MRLAALGVFIALAVAWLAVPARSTAAGSLSATLDGRSIEPTRVGDYHCHDLDYPIIRCFRKAADLDIAIGDVLGRDDEGAVTPDAAVAVVGYVRVYVDQGFGGSSMLISHAYNRLGDIGWNDRVSSFKTLTSDGGTFWQHTFGAGWGYDFCCYGNVTYVGSAYNDQFSSVYPG
jgi:hypothetical protein